MSNFTITGSITIGGTYNGLTITNGSISGATFTATTVNATTFAGGTFTGSTFNGVTLDNTAWSTYVPVITAGTGTFTSVSGAGRYKQIGKTVFLQVTITITTNGSAANFIIATLPITAAASSNCVVYGREDAVTGFMQQGRNNGTGAVIVLNYNNTYPGADGAIVKIAGTYEAA